jgi:lysophospholipase L1-like esterase
MIFDSVYDLSNIYVYYLFLKISTYNAAPGRNLIKLVWLYAWIDFAFTRITMKRVLCFGDSNTWGYDPATQERFDRDTRWAGVLRNTLGEGYEIIEEGLNGRTTVWEDPIEGYKNGYAYLIPCLETHRPLDLVIIMLGTNDLKMRFSLPPSDIARGAGVLVKATQQSEAGRAGKPPKILLIAPPPVARLGEFGEMFAGAEEKSKKLGGWYRQIAAELDCAFLDAGGVIVSSDLDGIHFETPEHRKLGLAVARQVQALIG